MDEQLNHIPAGYFTCATNGIVLSINQPLLEILDYSEEEVVGQHLNYLLAKSAKVFTQLYFFPLVLAKKRIDEMYLTLANRSGEEIPVLMNASLSPNVENQMITFVMIPMQNRDEYENQLIIARKTAEDALGEISKVNATLEETLKALEENERKILEVNRQNEDFKVAIQNELKLAKKIQARSLPREISNMYIETESYYLASGELSGDIYGSYQINEHQYGIIILDVMGHGISSALITMSLQSLFQMLMTKGTTTNIVMKELDNHLHTLFKNNAAIWHYSTGICLIIDTEHQTIECTNAGHPAAIFQDPMGNQIELNSTSPPIGTFEEMTFEIETLNYQKGSKILLYTDGISDPLGPTKLNDLLRECASDSVLYCKEKILQAIHMQGTGHFKQDDRCFIVIDLK